MLAIALVEAQQLPLQQAIHHVQEQEHESAIRTFLQLLAETSPQVSQGTQQLPEEEKCYQDALSLYLQNTGRAAKKAAQQILDTYAPIVEAHPDDHLLTYLVALAYANTDQYIPFFTLFYRAFLHHPHHFLAFKTQALLHHKLMLCARDPAVAQAEKEQVYQFVQQALRLNSQDISLHQMSLSFAPPDQKKKAVTASLNIIIHNTMIVPRGDLLFFVKEAESCGEIELAEQFVQKARSWYPVSQQLDAAQRMLRNRR